MSAGNDSGSDGTGPSSAEEPSSPPVQDERERGLPKGEAEYQESFSVGEKLGEGSYAQVFRCTHRKSGEGFAVKVIDKAKAGAAELHGVLHEAQVMRDLSHENIVRLHDQFDGPRAVYLIVDYIEGSTLFERITKSRHFSESIASGVVKNVLSALDHIHASDYMHRDLKPENLLMKWKALDPDHPKYITSMTSVVIADFGLCGRPPSTTCCGFPSYVAPEVLRGVEYDASCDVWSLGVIVYIMLAGEKPFSGENQRDTFRKIVSEPLVWKNRRVWDVVSHDAKEFVAKLLEKDPNQRVSAQQAQRDAWITGADLSQSESRDTHMEGSITALQKFRLREKFATAMNVFKVAGVTNATIAAASPPAVVSPRIKRMKSHVRLPTWTRYVLPSGFSLVIEVKSQTNSEVRKVDLGLLMQMDASKSDFRLQQLCTCPSAQVCRHIQYVYHYFFVGCWDAEILPHIHSCQRQRVLLLEDCGVDTRRRCVWSTGAAALGTVGAIGSAAGTERVVVVALAAVAAFTSALLLQTHAMLSVQEARFKELKDLDDLLFCAREFKRLYDLVPEADMKNVVFGCIRSPAGSP